MSLLELPLVAADGVKWRRAALAVVLVDARASSVVKKRK